MALDRKDCCSVPCDMFCLFCSSCLQQADSRRLSAAHSATPHLLWSTAQHTSCDPAASRTCRSLTSPMPYLGSPFLAPLWPHSVPSGRGLLWYRCHTEGYVSSDIPQEKWWGQIWHAPCLGPARPSFLFPLTVFPLLGSTSVGVCRSNRREHPETPPHSWTTPGTAHRRALACFPFLLLPFVHESPSPSPPADSGTSAAPFHRSTLSTARDHWDMAAQHNPGFSPFLRQPYTYLQLWDASDLQLGPFLLAEQPYTNDWDTEQKRYVTRCQKMQRCPSRWHSQKTYSFINQHSAPTCLFCSLMLLCTLKYDPFTSKISEWFIKINYVSQQPLETEQLNNRSSFIGEETETQEGRD